MTSEDDYLGCPYAMNSVRALNDKLNAKVVEQINRSQELVMMNSFAHESNEYLFKKSLEERISNIASWRWVLIDLNKRLEEAIGTLHHEHNALRVVVQRIQNELDEQSREASRPGALSPNTDIVEDAIIQEFNFLRDYQKKFEKMIPELDKQKAALEKTKKRIEVDTLNKQQALSIDESCAKMNLNYLTRIDNRKKKKKKSSPLARWEKRCEALKRAGLRALSNAIITRQQARGARVHLSIAAQAYASRVDTALRRRLHANKIKLQDLSWQKEEAIRDYNCLEEELATTEQNLLETMEQARMVEARLADRTLRPNGELTRDDVDKKLRDELGRLRSFTKQLRINHERITSLQNNLTDCITRVECCAVDLIRVVSLDEERIRSRLGNPQVEDAATYIAPVAKTAFATSSTQPAPPPPIRLDVPLTVISEDDEDDYPFDDE